MTTYDQLAMRAMLRGDSDALQALCLDAQMAIGAVCPDCGGTDTESNGGTEYRCQRCDHRWGTECGERYGF